MSSKQNIRKPFLIEIPENNFEYQAESIETLNIPKKDKFL